MRPIVHARCVSFRLVGEMSEAALSASDDSLVGEPICRFLCCFWRQADVDFVWAFRADGAIVSFHSARFIVNDIVRHRGPVTTGTVGSSATRPKKSGTGPDSHPLRTLRLSLILGG